MITSALVTGAAGFIGSHVAEECLRRGWQVTAVDSFTNYYGRAIKDANAKLLRGNPACTFIERDLLDVDLEALLSTVDVVFHLAAQPGVRASWGHSFDLYSKNNVTVLQRLLEAARDKPLRRIVFASSSSVYGDAESFPTHESLIARPVSPYGMTKAAGELLAHVYWRNYGLPIVTVRYFTVYGPRQRPDMAFHRLFNAVLRDDEFRVFGDGTQTRDFTFVADTVAGTLAAGLHGAPGGTYNIGGGSRTAMTEVFALIEEITGKPLRLSYMATQRGDARDTSADVSRAERELDYRPTRSLRTGLAEQLEWHRLHAALL